MHSTSSLEKDHTPCSHSFEHVVIGGAQRSGTSLVRALVGSHPQISIYQWDLPLWMKFSEIYADRNLSKKGKKKLISEVLSHRKFRLADCDFTEADFDSILNNEEIPSHKFFDAFYQTFLSLYLKETHRGIVGIKTPGNEFYAEDLFIKFPKTKFIHVLRNPLDVAVSLKEAKNKWWSGKINYNSHIHLCKKSAEIALKNLKQYPDNYLVIKYEDVVNNPSDAAEEICKFLQIDFQEEMLELSGQPGWRGSNSSFEKKSNESNFKSSPINRYKDQMPENIQRLYFHFLNEHLKYFGYPHKEVSLSLKCLLSYRVNLLPQWLQDHYSRLSRRSSLYFPVKKPVKHKEA